MGLFGHGGLLSKAKDEAKNGLKEISHVGHHISNVINKPIHAVNHMMGYDRNNPENNGNSWYIGYNSNSGPMFYEGWLADQIMGGGYTYNNIKKNPYTYKGNTAKTANSIKQGGMTKDDLIAYNQKHPNETAGTIGSMKTSLNSNTATTRY